MSSSVSTAVTLNSDHPEGQHRMDMEQPGIDELPHRIETTLVGANTNQDGLPGVGNVRLRRSSRSTRGGRGGTSRSTRGGQAVSSRSAPYNRFQSNTRRRVHTARANAVRPTIVEGDQGRREVEVMRLLDALRQLRQELGDREAQNIEMRNELTVMREVAGRFRAEQSELRNELFVTRDLAARLTTEHTEMQAHIERLKENQEEWIRYVEAMRVMVGQHPGNNAEDSATSGATGGRPLILSLMAVVDIRMYALSPPCGPAPRDRRNFLHFRRWNGVGLIEWRAPCFSGAAGGHPLILSFMAVLMATYHY